HGEIVLEAENTVITGRNPTFHAETNLMREAAGRFEPDYLARCTMYSSAEPCAMCAGTTYWANVRRIVYGLDIPGLDEVVGADQAQLLEPVDPVRHRRRREQEALRETRRSEGERRTAPTQRRQHVELPPAEPLAREHLGHPKLQEPGRPQQAGEEGVRLDVEL